MRALAILLLAACWTSAPPTSPSNTSVLAPVVTGPDSIPSSGNPAARVRIVSYYNYRCPHCIAFEPILDQLVTKYGDKIFVQYRTLRLPAWADSDDAATAALAAHRQGQFLAMHRALFAAAKNLAAFDAATLRAHAVKLGLDVARFERDLADPALRARVAKDSADAEAAEVSYVPFLFIAGKPYEGDRELAPLGAHIDSLLR